MEPRLRRWKSGNIQLEKCVCGKAEGGPADGRGNLRLGIVLGKTEAVSWIDPALKWSADLDSGSVIEFKTTSFKPSDENDSNVEVTGEAL